MDAAISRSVNNLQMPMTNNLYIGPVLMSVATSATLIPLGQVTQPHWAFFMNRDAVNYVRIRNGASGADVVRLYAGEPAFLPLDDTGTYYAIANSAPVLLEYMVFSL